MDEVFRLHNKPSRYRYLRQRVDHICEMIGGGRDEILPYLTLRQRQVLELRLGTKEKLPMSVIQVARLLEISPSTVYNICRLAVIKIEKRLQMGELPPLRKELPGSTTTCGVFP